MHVVEDSPAVTIDIAQSGILDPRVRGILGGSFLEHFDVLIDNRRHLICLDDKGDMAAAIKGERIPLAEPYGPQTDIPFTRPIEISARLSAMTPVSVLLRLDSGSNVPALYSWEKWMRPATLRQLQHFKLRSRTRFRAFGSSRIAHRSEWLDGRVVRHSSESSREGRTNSARGWCSAHLGLPAGVHQL